MKKLTVKYRHGEMELHNLHNLSGAMLRQILEQVQPELRELAGDYTWHLNQLWSDKGGYEYQIVAQWGSQTWVDGRGKTPRLAAKSWYVLRAVLERHGVDLNVA